MRFRRGFEHQPVPSDPAPAEPAPASPVHVRVSAGAGSAPPPAPTRRRQFQTPPPDSAPSARARPSVAPAQQISAAGVISASRYAGVGAPVEPSSVNSRRRQLPQVEPTFAPASPVSASPVPVVAPSAPPVAPLPVSPPVYVRASASASLASLPSSGGARRRQYVDPQASSSLSSVSVRPTRGSDVVPVGISTAHRRQLPQAPPSEVHEAPVPAPASADPVAAARSHMMTSGAGGVRVRGTHSHAPSEISGVNARRRQMVQTGDVGSSVVQPSMSQANAMARKAAFDRFLQSGAAPVDPDQAKAKAAADIAAAQAAAVKRRAQDDVTVQVVQVTIPSSEIRKIAEEAVSKVAVAAASDAMKALPLDPPVHEPSIQDHPESATASSSEDVEELPESSFDEVGEDSEDETDDDLFEDVGIGDDEDSEDSDLG